MGKILPDDLLEAMQHGDDPDCVVCRAVARWAAKVAPDALPQPEGPVAPDDARRIDCQTCGTPNATCWSGVLRGGHACCGSCRYTENHPAVGLAP